MLLFSSVLVSCFADIISESGTRAQNWDQKAQSEACLLSAVHTVHHEKTQTPRQRGISHTTTRRLFMSHRRKGGRGKQICHRQEAVRERKNQLNHNLVSQRITCFKMSTKSSNLSVGSIRYSTLCLLSVSSAMGPSSSLQPHWPWLKN